MVTLMKAQMSFITALENLNIIRKFTLSTYLRDDLYNCHKRLFISFILIWNYLDKNKKDEVEKQST